MNLFYYINKLEQKRYSTLNHLYALINKMSDEYGKTKKNELNFLSFNVTPIMLEAEFQPTNFKIYKSFIPQQVRKLLFHQLRIPIYSSQIRNSIIHYFDLPIYKNMKKIINIFEITSLTNFMLPDFFQKKQDLYLFAKKLKLIDIIIVHSDYIKQKLIEKFYIDKKNIIVINKPVQDNFFSISTNDSALNLCKKEYFLPEKYLLFVGKISKYKNIEILIRAFAKAAPKNFSLIFAGSFDTKNESYKNAHNYFKKLNQLAKQLIPERYKFIDYVKHNLMPALMHEAAGLVEPSFFNNFPDTIAEAQAVGIPVIASQIEAHQSVCKDSLLYFSPLSQKSLEEAIETVVNNSKTILPLINRGKNYSTNYKWEKIAPEYIKLYDSIV